MRIMAIDYGDAHTGVAVSDLTQTIAGYTTTLHSRREEQVLAGIQDLIAEYDVGELVLGYPKNMDGSLGPRAEKADRLAELLRRATGLPVTLWDERRTTVDAHNILQRNGKNARQHKSVVDAVAASLMLEGYLSFRKSQNR